MEPSDVTYLEVSFVCDVSAFINHIVVWQQPPCLAYLSHILLTHSLPAVFNNRNLTTKASASCVSCQCNDPSKEILAQLGQVACSIPQYLEQCGAHRNELSSTE